MATTLRHAQSAMQSETAKREIPMDFIEDVRPPEHTSAPEKTYVVFKLVKKNVRRLNLDGISDGINPKTGSLERIYLIRGARSIWQSELTDLLNNWDKPNSYVSKNRMSLKFQDGICRVPVIDHLTLEFAKANIHNVGKKRNGSGKYDYYEYDAAEEQKMRYEKQLSRINLIQLISTMEENKMIKLALFLGVKPYDDETALPKTPNGYRTELLVKADTQPDTVNKYINSQEVEVSYLIRKAISEAKIDLGGANGTVTWAGGGGHIAKIPSGRKPVEYLTELAMTNSNEGKQFKQQLETLGT